MALYARGIFRCPRCKKIISADSRICPYCARTFNYGEIEKIRKQQNLKAMGVIFLMSTVFTGIKCLFNRNK